ncbi:HTH-type transcriptional regulator Ptr2 [Candidatus Methanoplasma termitum]|uniref:Ptr2 protein n=1 Tax=Candidatus Methanoplasma termitum TaxID=1577791 RepID=A0A0A7LA71_9ARCH|nr:Lrp/AsnC family transcriptional regulator [Candidatus Methanoplasma termitum]AIZ55974.1 HTH-type transcriptional regulator Ptr2 [Candidatus Methanoplasma termitum]MCL2334414.1 Lrp/AsnC family transcriptional regulator [Candidatus Methanoplasma sp.]
MANIKDFDDLDRKIIELLCTSSQGSFRQIAKQLNVHPTTLIQRVKNLEAKGVVNGYRAKINYLKLGFDYMGVVHIYMDDVINVQERIKAIPQVMAIYDVTGDADCIAMISCMDRDEFSETVKKINSVEGVKKTNTSVILNVIKDMSDFVPVLKSRE